jgi:hypothetical protein
MHHNTYTKPCINHATQLYQTMHQPCTTTCTIWLNHQPCTSIFVAYHVPTMYLNHIPYHSIMPYTKYHRIYQESTINGVPQQSTNITKRFISYMCCHIPSVFLNNVSILMTTIHHVPMLQEYKHQSCTISPYPCNQTRYQYNITTNMYY